VRLLACALAYVVLYFAFGRLAIPFMREFYEARTLPPFGPLVALQVVRGLAFAALCLAWLRQPWPRPVEAALWTGTALSVVGGIAPLLLPNPYLPAAVRMVHLWEVGISNFLFGCAVAWILGRRAGAAQDQAEVATAR
jgi:hypothetical protein